MNDTSVWFTEVDTALKALVEATVVLDGSPVNFFVKMPEKEFFIQKYPAVTIYPLYNNPDKSRTDPLALTNPNYYAPISKDTNLGTETLEKLCVPYLLTYQMDFWSQSKATMNTITSMWLSEHSNEFILPVLDRSNNERSCLARMRSGLMERDDLLSGIRVFHSYVTYSFEAEIDLGIQATKPLIKQVNIEVEN